MHPQPCVWRLSSSCAFCLTFVISSGLISLTLLAVTSVAYFELVQFAVAWEGRVVGRERGEKREFMKGREMRMLEKNSPKMQLICLYLYLRLMGCVAMSAVVTHI